MTKSKPKVLNKKKTAATNKISGTKKNKVKSVKKKPAAAKKMSSAKKVLVKKVAAKKVLAKKVLAKKVAAKKISGKKVSAKKVSSMKISPKKVAAVKKNKAKVKAHVSIKSKNGHKTKSIKGKVVKLISRNETPVSVTVEKKIRKFKPNKKVKYTVSELKYFREIILKERKAILESAKANMESLVDNETGEYKGDNLTYSTHMAEQGTDEMEREKNYMFVQRDEKYLGYLQDALMRIDQGTYGICVDCKDEQKNLCRTCPLIQKERLELVPITQHCIECKNIRG